MRQAENLARGGATGPTSCSLQGAVKIWSYTHWRYLKLQLGLHVTVMIIGALCMCTLHDTSPYYYSLFYRIKVECGGWCSKSDESQRQCSNDTPGGETATTSTGEEDTQSVGGPPVITGSSAPSRRRRSRYYRRPHSNSTPSKRRPIYLWQFLRDLLQLPQRYHAGVRWIDRDTGTVLVKRCFAVFFYSRTWRPYAEHNVDVDQTISLYTACYLRQENYVFIDINLFVSRIMCRFSQNSVEW